MLTTTKRRLRAAGACAERYQVLCMWAPSGDDEPIPLVEILDRQGIYDATWALMACDDTEALARWYARWCALMVVHLWQPPAEVVEYLRTGDDALGAAAWAATWSAAGDTARGAARGAAAPIAAALRASGTVVEATGSGETAQEGGLYQ